MIPVFVINLDRSVDRWKRWERFQDVTREPAVDGSKIDVETNPNISLRTKAMIMGREPRTEHYQINTKGAVGCYMSHVNLLRKIVKMQLPLAIICEDDLDLTFIRDNMVSQAIMHSVTDDMLQNHDVVVFGQIQSKNPLSYWGAWCSVWTLRGATIALQHAYPIEGHVDHFFNSLANLGLIRLKLLPASQLVRTNDMGRSMVEHEPLANNMKCHVSSSMLVIMVFVIFSVICFVCARK